jgi:hypothetical protein
MIKNKIFFTTLLLVLITSNFYAQINETVYLRSDRFVLEYIKQIQPGDNYVLTGFKLFEFFNNELIHVDSSMASSVSPVQFKDFNNNSGFYDFGKTTNKRNLSFNLSNYNESDFGYFYEGDLYNEDMQGRLFLVSDILASASKKIFFERQFKKSSGISKKDIYESLNDYGYDELIEVLKMEDGRIRLKDGIDELSYKSFIIDELNFDPESNSFYYMGTRNKLTENQTFDYDGNVYKTVNINGQVWMAENLRATHFSNGDEIRMAKSNIEWSNLNTPGISAGFLNVDSTGGYFYNGYTLIDERNVCPLGFHVPNNRDIAQLYNSINVYDDRVKIKANGVAKVKIYPKIFAPIIEPIGAALTIGAYGIAGTVDLVGNAAWAVTDLLILGPVKLWKKKVTVKTDTLTYETIKRTAFPTYEGFSLFAELLDEGFHLVLPPSLRLNYDDYENFYGEDERNFSHLDKLKSSDGQKLTDEYKFNLTNDNVILMAELNGSEYEAMENEVGDEMGYDLSFVTIPFTNYDRILFWGNKMDHELQQMKYYKYSLFVNRNGAKVRCVKD